ncbi:MAG: tetratricopeptide repeat protein [Candidatus Binatia bacterium]
MCGCLRLLAAVSLLMLPVTATAADPAVEGLKAYVAGRFDEAAVGLKQSIREGAEAKKPEAAGQTPYFLGRSFHELGLRGLALHYLGQAELYGRPGWRLLAQRELARVYFEAGDHAAVLQVLDRLAGAAPDGEICYFAGLAAAEQREWAKAIDILGRISPASEYYIYGLYARAQSRAASGDLRQALFELDEVIARAKNREPSRARKLVSWFSSSEGRPVALLEQARVLRGKILYVEGRKNEARSTFATVESGGHLGLEAVRGLMMTGAGADSAAKVEAAPSRAVDTAALLTVKAIAAEEHGDVDGARRIRAQIRSLVRARLDTLERLASQQSAESALEKDLAEFWRRLRRARFEEHWREEAPLVDEETAGALGSPKAEPDVSFVPQDGVFYGVWDQTRMDGWLQGLIELRARSEVLERDLGNVPKRPFWKFWGGDEEHRLGDSLMLIRLADLRLLLADHLHNFALLSEEDYSPTKLRSVESGVSELDRLYLGSGVKIPEALVNLEKTLEYKKNDMVRLVQFVPERATDPVISLFGNYVDLLADMRSRLAQAGGMELPKVSDLSSALRARVQSENRRLAAELSGHIRKAIEPTRRAQLAFFTRVAADNEGSLSRLYGRAGSGQAAGEGKGEK